MTKRAEISLDGGVNAAVFCKTEDEDFTNRALAPWTQDGGLCVMSSDDGFLSGVFALERLSFLEVLKNKPEELNETALDEFLTIAHKVEAVKSIIVDMSWALNTIWASSLLERWGGIAERFVEATQISLISLYHREFLVEDQLAAAMRAHRVIAAPSGLYSNPYWLPQDLITKATLQEQLSFYLGALVPEFKTSTFHATAMPDLARGATPRWARRSEGLMQVKTATRWHIHCLGQLRVHTEDGQLVDWAISGSAPKKSRALFAYLLNRGEAGAHVDRLCELLWPETIPEDTKRSRLRHTITMLRKSLGGADRVVRSVDDYKLNIPQGSWIDIRAFEQLCRRGLSLFKHGDYVGASRVYEAAEKLYRGDLFEDLSLAYVESDYDDWCLPKRMWLREMAIKLQYDMSKVLRKQGRNREALEHALKAIQMDPLSDDANIEAMYAYAAQNRMDAVTRQYEQYQKAAQISGETDSSDELKAVYRELSSTRLR